jgi:pyruvate ferredoxin oxidoreductase gamma subunit
MVNLNKEMISVVMHGRGGQGAKTAAMLLARVAINLGKHAQAFPEYGPERTGAPVRSYVRLSNHQIRTHEPVIAPDIILIIDDSLIDFVDVTKGMQKTTDIIVNTTMSADALKKKLSLPKNFIGRIAVVNATKIAVKHIGQNKSNTSTLSAALKIIELIPFNDFLRESKAILLHKLGKERTTQNIDAMKDAYAEVKLI